jgi:hypothetical protein
VPSGGALGKVPVNVICPVTATFLCRVPDKKHSAKRSLLMNFFVVYSLPSVFRALLSALDTR